MTTTPTTVVTTDEFADWFMNLDDEQTKLVVRIVDLLELRGIHLSGPYSRSLVPESRMAVRELRVQSVKHPIRIAYAFNPDREAVLLVAGSKKGVNERRFLRDMVVRAEALWTQYMADWRKRDEERRCTGVDPWEDR